MERICQIATDLRCLARDPGDTAEEVPPSAAIDEPLRLASVRLRKVAHLDLRLTPGLPALLCSRGRLLQVLVNLLANAADAVDGAGRTVRVTTSLDEDAIVFAVDDDGPGIPPVGEEIFAPFFTTREATGMGLGLALCRNFAERLGGSVEAGRSELGGARFALGLPAARAGAPASEAA